tara:strand:- start:27243 stop:28826 length:1584 start_codon:yes stop_codon:yes gene_type:complete
MARIYRTDIYDYNTLPTFDDYVIGTDPVDSNRTRNYRIADIIGLANGTATNFTTLFDTPADYTGQAGKSVIVNGTEDGLIFGTASGNFVTLDTVQSITEYKTFEVGGIGSTSLGVDNGISVGKNTGVGYGFMEMIPVTPAFDTSFNPSFYQGGNKQYRIGINAGDWILTGTSNEASTIVPYTRLVQNYTAPRTQTWQDKDGTIAHLADIPAAVDLSNYVTLSTVQTISGVKTFSNRMSTASFNMLPNGGGVLSGRHTLYINNSNQLAWLGLSSTKGVYLDQSLITSGNPIVKFQATGGTIAHLTDIPTNHVTTDTTQTITGYKTFSGGILINDSLSFTKRATNLVSASQGVAYFKTDNTFNISVGTGVATDNATFDGIDAFTAARTFTLPDANGTIALTPITTAFTPDIIDTTAGATYSHTTATGEYVRVGDLVTFSIAITNISTTGTGSGELRITGLPLSPARTSSALVELSGFIGTNFYQLQARVTTAGNIDFRYQAALDDSMSTLPAATIDAGTAIYITGSIIV